MVINNLLFKAINYLLVFIEFAIIARVIFSFIQIKKYTAIIKFIFKTTEPILCPIRRAIKKSPIGNDLLIDLSPLIALILINILKHVVARLFY